MRPWGVTSGQGDIYVPSTALHVPFSSLNVPFSTNLTLSALLALSFLFFPPYIICALLSTLPSEAKLRAIFSASFSFWSGGVMSTRCLPFFPDFLRGACLRGGGGDLRGEAKVTASSSSLWCSASSPPDLVHRERDYKKMKGNT